MKRGFRLKSLLDTTLFLAVVTLINIFWFQYDPAFRSLSWHPYILIITLIGLFYGFREALGSVLLCNLVYSSQLAFSGYSFSTLLTNPDKQNLLAFLIVGLFFGEAGELYRRGLSYLRQREKEASEELKKVQQQNDDLKEVNTELQQRIQLEQAQLAEIYGVSDRLFSLDENKVLSCVLELTAEILGADQCALYLYDQKKNHFWRHAEFPDNSLASNPVFVGWDKEPLRQLREEPHVCTVRDVLTVDTPDPAKMTYFMAAPLLVENKIEAVVFVEKMPFLRLAPSALQNMAFLADIFSKALSNARQVGAKKKLGLERDEKYFYERVEEEVALSDRHKGHMNIVEFEIVNYEHHKKALGSDVMKSIVGKVLHVVKKQQRKSDSLFYRGGGRFSLLMPRTSEEKTYSFISRAKEEVGRMAYPTEPNTPIELTFKPSEKIPTPSGTN